MSNEVIIGGIIFAVAVFAMWKWFKKGTVNGKEVDGPGGGNGSGPGNIKDR